MENHHFHGKIHYKWPFSIAMLVHQRVYEGIHDWPKTATLGLTILGPNQFVRDSPLLLGKLRWKERNM